MRISNDVLDAVCFIGTKASDGTFVPRGTGYLVLVPDATDPGWGHVYVVTAKHNITMPAAKKQLVYLRINTNDAGYGVLEIGDHWRYANAPACDIAVAGIAPPLRFFRYKVIPFEMLVTSSLESAYGIGIGDTLAIPGLFQQHYGQRRNIPIVRTGSIAAMRSDEPLYCNDFVGEYHAYIAEVQAIGGMSGSPVFVVIPNWRLGRPAALGWEVKLLGQIRGHWTYQPLSSSATAHTAEESRALDELRGLHTGMALITPADDLAKLIAAPLGDERITAKVRLEPGAQQ